MDNLRRFPQRLPPAVATALALTAWLAGCGTTESEIHPAWPESAPRVRHVKNIRSGGDLVKPNFFDSLARMITGAGEIKLIRPHGVAVQEGKYLYVTDQELQALVVYSLTAPKATAITHVNKEFLTSPVGVAAVGDAVAVSDSALNAVYLLTPTGKLVRKIEKPGGFRRPTGLAYTPRGDLLYVVDTLANEVCVFEASTGRLVRRFGSQGIEPGQFNYPTHVFVDRDGNLYVTDSMNFRVQVFDPDGKSLFQVGKLGDASGHLAVPKGVAVDSQGHLYIIDSYFGALQIFDRKGQLLLSIGDVGEEPGKFMVPTGLALDSRDRIYVCDSFNKRIQILQYLGEPSHEPNSVKPQP